MIRALHRKVRRLSKACLADRPAHEIRAFMLHGLAATADEAGCEVIRERLRQLRGERGPRGGVDSPAAGAPGPGMVPELAVDAAASPVEPQVHRPGAAEPVAASGAAAKEPPIYQPDPSSPRQQWQQYVNKPPNGPRPPPPPPYRDHEDDDDPLARFERQW